MKTNCWTKQCLSLLVVGAMGISAASGATVLFQEGASNEFVSNYSGTSDNTLAGNVATWNGGALNYFAVGRNFTRRSLLRFDLSSLAGEVGSIDSASITLSLSGNATSANLTIAVYQFSAANAGWQEGAGILTGVAASGESTWSHLNYNTGAWAGSAGASTAGVDYYATPVTTFVWKPGDVAVTFDLTAEMVKQWIDNPATNGGLLFIATDGAGVTQMTASFASSENANQALRPLLSIDYAPIPEPSTWALLAAAGGGLLLRARRRRE